MAGKISPVAPVLTGADEEYLHASLPTFGPCGEEVGLGHGLRIDALMLLDLRQRANAIPVDGGGFVVEVGGGLVHQPHELLLRFAAAALQKIARFGNQPGVVLAGNLAGARCTATLDLEEKAGPCTAFEDAVGAGAQQECLLQGVQGGVDGAGACEGSEIVAAPGAGATVFQHLREFMIAGQQDMREGFVVPHQHVVARLQPLDQIGFEQQRVGFGRRRDEFHLGRRRDHAGDAVRLSGELGVAGDALFQASRLADIEQLAVAVIHAVNARTVGQ